MWEPWIKKENYKGYIMKFSFVNYASLTSWGPVIVGFLITKSETVLGVSKENLFEE